ncbi:hypothetical protein BH20ACI2_BH20ACI2_18830 [soil metagenome]
MPRKPQVNVRWFLLICVLAGSFFSSGEGVQLLPFPDRDEPSEKGASDLAGGTHRSYTLSVHNLTSSKVSKANSPRKAPKEIVAYRPESSGGIKPIIAPDLAANYDRMPSAFDNQPAISWSPGRAPPAISILSV